MGNFFSLAGLDPGISCSTVTFGNRQPGSRHSERCPQVTYLLQLKKSHRGSGAEVHNM
ncbi:unnamed protein product, partial [Nesidiocoris tenuis]